MYLRLLLSALLLSGCTGTIYTPTTISHRFSPEPAVEESTRKALARWVAATGIGLAIASKGTEITVQNDWIIDNKGQKNCGVSFLLENRIVVSTVKENCGYWSFDSLVLHEIGHMITFNDGHSETGIMAPGGSAENRECIDANSLEFICAGTDCEIFEPEC